MKIEVLLNDFNNIRVGRRVFLILLILISVFCNIFNIFLDLKSSQNTFSFRSMDQDFDESRQKLFYYSDFNLYVF